MPDPLLCADLGGTRFRAAVIESSGTIHSEISRSMPQSREDLGALLLAEMDALLQHHPRIGAVSFSVPWVISEQASQPMEFCHQSSYATNFADISFMRHISASLKVKGHKLCFINDVNAAVLGEQWQGALRSVRNGLYINLGTGVSMGILLNGELYTGANSVAGELAFCLSSPDEMYSRAVQIPHLEDLVGGKKILAQREGGGREWLQRSFDTLSMHVINLCYVINPEKIVLGGGVVGHNPSCLQTIRQWVEEKVPKSMAPEICQSAIYEHVSLLGAARHAWKCIPNA